MSKFHATVSKAPGRVSLVPPSAPEAAAPKRGVIAEAKPQAAGVAAADPESRRLMIAEAAYYRAEKRGFAPGGELQDWLDAEAQLAEAFH
jgi:hypothetical protein